MDHCVRWYNGLLTHATTLFGISQCRSSCVFRVIAASKMWDENAWRTRDHNQQRECGTESLAGSWESAPRETGQGSFACRTKAAHMHHSPYSVNLSGRKSFKYHTQLSTYLLDSFENCTEITVLPGKLLTAFTQSADYDIVKNPNFVNRKGVFPSLQICHFRNTKSA